MCVFQRKTDHISDTAKITINHQQKVAYSLSDKIEIIDLG